MAQVKKFKNPAGQMTVDDDAAAIPAGDQTPAQDEPAKKYGKWIRNGVVYEMDDEKMKSLETYISTLDPDQQIIAADYWKRLQSGQDININTMTNESDVAPSTFNPRQMKRLDADRPKERIWDSFANTRVHKYNKTTYLLGQWNPDSKASVKPDAVKKTPFGMGSGTFEYDAKTNTDGSISYTYRNPLNEPVRAHFDRFKNYLTGDDAYRAQFDTSGVANMDHILNWYKRLEDGAKWLSDLWTKIETGSELNRDEQDYLTMIGLKWNKGQDTTTREQELAAEVDAARNQAWTTFNADNVWGNDAQKYFTYDANTGQYSLNLANFHNGFDVNKNYFFNDEFVENNPGQEWQRGKIWYNGKWYKGSDLNNPNSEIYKLLAARDYFNANRRGEYGAANDIMMTSWNGQETLIPARSEESASYIGSFYSTPFLYENRNYHTPTSQLRVQTGKNTDGSPIYTWLDLDGDYIIWRGIDLSEEDDFINDGTGRRNWSWRLTDAYGNPVTELGGRPIANDFTRDDFANLYDPSVSSLVHDPTPPTPKRRVSTDPTSAYYKYYMEQGPYGYVVYKNPELTDTVRVTMPSEYSGLTFDNMPTEIYNEISTAAFKTLLDNDPKLGRQFLDLVKTGDVDRYLQSKISSEVIDYFANRRIVIPAPITSNKKGGILKAQSGRVVNLGYKPEETTLSRADEINERFTNPFVPQHIRKDGESQFWEGMSKTDGWMLTGLALDAAGFLAGNVPVYGDIANGVLSTIGSNIAYGIADRRMVKAGAAPKGTTLKNIALNVGLDVAGIVPVLGDAANAAGWARKLVQFLKSSSKALEWFKTTMAGIGLYNGLGSLDKLINGEDLTTDDLQALMYGVMAATGLTKRGVHAANEARLAKHSHPGVEPIPYATKFKNADGTEDTLTFNPDDIRKATAFFNRGDKKSRAELVRLIKAKKQNIPDEEINRILGDPNALRELGLVHETRITGNGYSEAKPEAEPSTWRYFFNPTERRNVLAQRTPAQIAEASTRGRGMRTVASDVLYARGEGVPEGYQRTEPHWWMRNRLVKSPTEAEPPTRTSGTEQNQRVDSGSDESVRPADPVENPNPNPRPADPEINTENPARPSPMDASTAQSRLTPESPSQKKFFEKFKATLSDEGFKAFAESNPAKARELVDKAVAELISKSKTNKQKSTALAQRAEAMIKGHGYAFKKGGIIKASLGQQLRNFWGGVTNGVKYLSTPEGLRDLESGTRYVLGDMYNQRSADRTISSIKKSVDLSKPITPTEHYTPNVINAGNAERKLASGQFQYRPAATSDSNQYQAWKKQGYDQGNLHLASAIGLDSEQAATNLLRNIEERRNYAYNRTEGMNTWRKTAAAGESAIGEALNTTDRARIESLNQMIYQRQAQRDEDKKAALAYAEKKIAWETQQKIQEELDRRLKEAFPDDKPYDASNEEHRKTREAILREVQAMYQNANFDNEYSLLSPGEQRYYDKWISPALKRKGGSLRPASEQIAINREKSKDQIRVNKAKSQDRIWEASLKDARKALDKMSDRTHKIIMKLLS